MAIRDKIKAKFGKPKSSSSSSSDSSSNKSSVPGHYTGRTDIEYYKPHEIPKSKYRGRVDKAHQQKLDAFSFGDAFESAGRRASAALSGTFSPGGTKAFSRRASYVSAAGARTPARSSISSGTGGGSFSVPSSEGDSSYTRGTSSALMTPAEPVLTKSSNNDSIANSDLSRVGTTGDRPQTATEKSGIPTIRLDRQATITQKTPGVTNTHIEHSQYPQSTPFSADELTRAITRATISAH